MPHPDQHRDPQPDGRPPRWWRGAAARTAAVIGASVTLAVAIAVPTTALALGGSFSDVPPGHPFADPIGELADAGITQGYQDGTFRPTGNVKRQEMAAFLGRGLSRAEQDHRYVSLQSDLVWYKPYLPWSDTVIASVTVEAGAQGSGGGYVAVFGTASFLTNDEAYCPCRVAAEIVRSDGHAPGRTMFHTMSGAAQEDGYVQASVSPMAVFPIAAGQSGTYELHARVADDDVPTMWADSSLVAMYVPFDGSGEGLG